MAPLENAQAWTRDSHQIILNMLENEEEVQAPLSTLKTQAPAEKGLSADIVLPPRTRNKKNEPLYNTRKKLGRY